MNSTKPSKSKPYGPCRGQDTRQGAHKYYHDNGNLKLHCIYRDGKLHGEYRYYDYGILCKHLLCIDNRPTNIDISNLTSEEKTFLILQHDIEFLPDETS